MSGDKQVSLVQHLAELRVRLLLSLGFFLVSFLVSLFLAGPLYAFVTSQFEQKLLVLGPNDILWIYIQLASVTAVTFSLPFVTYQVWAFVRPGLTSREAKVLLAYVPAVFLCFLAGLAFGFFWVTPSLLQVLLGLGENLFATQLTATNYLVFVLHTTLPLAVLFELPVVVAFLTSLGLLSSSWLKTYRRYAYFGLIVLAVLLTPADLISDLVMSLPLILLYELSISLSTLIEAKKRR